LTSEELDGIQVEKKHGSFSAVSYRVGVQDAHKAGKKGGDGRGEIKRRE
jgi:hypothetical protein